MVFKDGLFRRTKKKIFVISIMAPAKQGDKKLASNPSQGSSIKDGNGLDNPDLDVGNGLTKGGKDDKKEAKNSQKKGEEKNEVRICLAREQKRFMTSGKSNNRIKCS